MAAAPGVWACGHHAGFNDMHPQFSERRVCGEGREAIHSTTQPPLSGCRHWRASQAPVLLFLIQQRVFCVPASDFLQQAQSGACNPCYRLETSLLISNVKSMPDGTMEHRASSKPNMLRLVLSLLFPCYAYTAWYFHYLLCIQLLLSHRSEWPFDVEQRA